MNRKAPFAEGEYYHIYNRGVDKRKIFMNDNDYRRFMLLLRMCNGEKPINFRDEIIPKGQTFGTLFDDDYGKRLVSIGAYCPMPNHFHILIYEKYENGISRFMQRLSTAYAMYFNKRMNRTGALFEGRFKAEHVNSDEYLKYLYAYIHLNPVKLIDSKWKEHGVKDIEETEAFLRDYEHSSYLDYIGVLRKEQSVLSREDFPDYFSNLFKFEKYLHEILTFEG